jgi:hypothetical protein
VETLVVVLATLAYGLVYAAAPGRQRPPIPPNRARVLQVVGGVVGMGALIVAGTTIGWGVGPVIWLAALVTAGTVLVVAWPLVDAAVGGKGRSSSASSGARRSAGGAAEEGAR